MRENTGASEAKPTDRHTRDKLIAHQLDVAMAERQEHTKRFRELDLTHKEISYFLTRIGKLYMLSPRAIGVILKK